MHKKHWNSNKITKQRLGNFETPKNSIRIIPSSWFQSVYDFQIHFRFQSMRLHLESHNRLSRSSTLHYRLQYLKSFTILGTAFIIINITNPVNSKSSEHFTFLLYESDLPTKSQLHQHTHIRTSPYLSVYISPSFVQEIFFFCSTLIPWCSDLLYNPHQMQTREINLQHRFRSYSFTIVILNMEFDRDITTIPFHLLVVTGWHFIYITS